MRHGPLHTVPGGLAVAAPTGLHLRLTTAAVTHQRGEEQLRAFRWGDVSSISVRLPGSWFPYPGAAATAGYALLTLLSQQVEAPEAEQSDVRVILRDGTIHDVPLDHAVGGYWRRAIANAEKLIAQFIGSEAKRALLDHPEQVIRRYIASTRWNVRTWK